MSILTRIYPFKQSRHWLKDSIAYGVVIWAILFLLQPFGFSMYQGNKGMKQATAQ
jgi:type II secretory pathway component PulL